MTNISDRLDRLTPLQRATVALKAMRSRLDAIERVRSEPIAIVGMACRFPGGANDLDGFWKLMSSGADAITEVPPDRWSLDDYYDPDPAVPGKMYTKWGGFLQGAGVDMFDAQFFGIAPREAANMDPQQRLLLEVSWEALENAGLTPEKLAGRNAGVFLGISSDDYSQIQMRCGNPAGIDPYTLTGTAFSVAGGRLSYVLGLRGPNIAVDTACSSSLVAVHLACQSLRSSESHVAIAGGVSLILSPELTIYFCKLRAMAADGRCKSFDADANGYVRGEGCGVVVLKRLSDAIADGDSIAAVIRGSAVNHDGRSSGLTVPNGTAQQEVIQEALRQAGVKPEQINYVETHGSGTALGDPIEVAALGAVLGKARSRDRPLRMGSVKTNIGHLEAAAGIAGLIKAVLSLQRSQIPPHLHFRNPNPNIPWGEIPLKVPVLLESWPNEDGPRLAGISSFGFSGTNAHAILEEAPPQLLTKEDSRSLYSLPISAQTPRALMDLREKFRVALQGEVEDLYAFCYSAALRRTHHPCRTAVVGATRQELIEQLETAEPASHNEEIEIARTVFVFPGQGSQWEGMGRDLLKKEPIFRASMEACETAFRADVDWSLISSLEGPECGEFLSRIDCVQPALFAIEVSLAALWRSWGVVPDAVVGHSLGEVAAAHVAGALSLEDAARIICLRSRLLRSASGKGAMCSVELSLEAAGQAIRGKDHLVSIAVSNSPKSTVLSGDPAALDEIMAAIEKQGVFCRRIRVDVASHSPQMDAFREELLELLDGIRPREGKLPIYSTVTGEICDGSRMDPAYWADNLRRPVLFSTALELLLDDEHRFFVELSPHPILLPFIEQSAQYHGKAAHALASLRRDLPEQKEILGNLASLYTRGYSINWDALFPTPGRCVPLPSYPWQRERFWISDDGQRVKPRDAGAHPLLDRKIELVSEDVHYWETELDTNRLAYLTDHRVKGTIVFPAAGWVEMLMAAARRIYRQAQVLEGIEFIEPLAFESTESRKIQLKIQEGTPTRFEIFSADAKGWTRHVRGSLRPRVTTEDDEITNPVWHEKNGSRRSKQEHYQILESLGLQYGPRFQGVEEVRWSDQRAAARISLDESLLKGSKAYGFHPALLDACFQVMGVPGTGMDGPYVPVSIERISYDSPTGSQLSAVAEWRKTADGEDYTGDIEAADLSGNRVLRVQGLRVRLLEQKTPGLPVEDCLYQTEWRERDKESQTSREIWETWVVFADEGGIAERIRDRVEALGGSPVFVSAGSNYKRQTFNRYTVNPADPEDFQRLFEDLASERGIEVLLYLWPLDQPSEPHPQRVADEGLRLVRLVQGICQANSSDSPALILVTRNGVQVSSEDEAVHPGQTLLLGLGRVLANEHPELVCARVDISPDPTDEEIDRLLHCRGSEPEIALRNGKAYVPRLVRSQAEVEVMPEPARGRPFTAVSARPGDLDRLTLQTMNLAPPGPGEVEIQVAATGLNFMNLMSALGTYPGSSDGFRSLGNECAGVVTRVGEGVAQFQAGDEVMGLANHCLASHARSLPALLSRKPETLSYEDAAAIPVVFLTAYYALHTLAHISSADRVLIHSATGGIGLAAIQLAQEQGAEIYATAGTDEKRELLKSLGIRHVMDSRSLEFVDQILEETGGRGVNVVLNSLSGEGMRRSLSLLAPFGRFLELGKRDLYGNGRLDPEPFRRSISYFTIDLDRMSRERPGLLGQMLSELLELFKTGKLRPLPKTEFPVSRMADAFRYMAGGKHVGKIVITQPDEDVLVEPRESSQAAFSHHSTYLITGGCGGLGLTFAEWMFTRGTRNLVLLGRGGASPEAQFRIDAINQKGGRLRVVKADVCDHAALASALDEIERSHPPLRGIIHAAGILEDSSLLNLDGERFRRVLEPKVAGAWNLHLLTLSRELDFLVFFSSAATVFGPQGQASYVAANAFLDGLAHYRRKQGRPAMTIQWGPVARVGMVAAQANRMERVAQEGVKSLSPEECTQIFETIFKKRFTTIAALPGAVFNSKNPLFAELAAHKDGDDGRGRSSSSFRDHLFGLASVSERLRSLESHLIEQVATTTRHSRTAINIDAPFKSLGIDSLMAMQLSTKLGGSLGLAIPVTSFWSHTTIRKYCDFLSEKLELGGRIPEAELSQQEEPISSGGGDELSSRQLQEMSEDEAARLLIRTTAESRSRRENI